MILKLLFILVLIYGLHEGGHYVYAKYKNCRPKFKVRYFGLWLEVEGFFEHLTFTEKFNLHFYAVAAGYMPVIIFFYNNHFGFVTLIYIVISSMDLLAMVAILLVMLKYGNRKLVDRFSLIG